MQKQSCTQGLFLFPLVSQWHSLSLYLLALVLLALGGCQHPNKGSQGVGMVGLLLQLPLRITSQVHWIQPCLRFSDNPELLCYSKLLYPSFTEKKVMAQGSLKAFLFFQGLHTANHVFFSEVQRMSFALSSSSRLQGNLQQGQIFWLVCNCCVFILLSKKRT